MHRHVTSSQGEVGTSMGVQKTLPPGDQKCGTRWGVAEGTLLLPEQRMPTANAVNSIPHGGLNVSHLYIDEFHESETPACSRRFVLNQDDPPHSLCAFLARTCTGLHRLRYRLWTRQRIEAPE